MSVSAQAQGNDYKRYGFRLRVLCPVTHSGPPREEVLCNEKNQITSELQPLSALTPIRRAREHVICQLSVLYGVTFFKTQHCINLKTTPRGKHHRHFVDDETEAKKRNSSGPQSKGTELEFKPRFSTFKACTLSFMPQWPYYLILWQRTGPSLRPSLHLHSWAGGSPSHSIFFNFPTSL